MSGVNLISNLILKCHRINNELVDDEEFARFKKFITIHGLEGWHEENYNDYTIYTCDISEEDEDDFDHNFDFIRDRDIDFL